MKNFYYTNIIVQHGWQSVVIFPSDENNAIIHLARNIQTNEFIPKANSGIGDIPSGQIGEVSAEVQDFFEKCLSCFDDPYGKGNELGWIVVYAPEKPNESGHLTYDIPEHQIPIREGEIFHDYTIKRR